MIPLLHPPFSPYSTPIVHEKVKGTASVMEPAKPEVPKKYSVNRHSKKRKADEAYMKKKQEIHQKMELYKRQTTATVGCVELSVRIFRQNITELESGKGY